MRIQKGGQLARDTKGNWITTQTEIDEALAFCLEVVSDARSESPPAYVLDVGYIESRGWAVIETNPVWASGIYGCDPTAVLSLLRRSCRTTSEMRLTDMKWVHS